MEPCWFMITLFFAEIATSTLWGWTRRASWSPCRGWGKVPWLRRESLARRTTARERRTEACAHPFILTIFCPPRLWSRTVYAFKQRDLAAEREGFKELFLNSFLGNSRLKCRAVIVAHWLKAPVYFLILLSKVFTFPEVKIRRARSLFRCLSSPCNHLLSPSKYMTSTTKRSHLQGIWCRVFSWEAAHKWGEYGFLPRFI